jgi:D-amino-acid dehydrogenase
MAAGENTVLVVGAGIVGISCAMFLQREGFEVTVVDRQGPGEGCSRGNAAGIATSEVIPMSKPGLVAKVPKWLFDPDGPLSVRLSYLPRLAPFLWRFLRAGSMDNVRDLAHAAAQLSRHAAHDHATLRKAADAEHLLVGECCAAIFDREAEFAAAQWEWDLRRELGAAFTKVSGAEMHALEPAVSPDIGCAVLLEGWRNLRDPYRFVVLLAERFAADGGLIERGEVTGFETGDGRVRAARLADGRSVEADAFVIAAGAWSHRLCAQLGSAVPLEADRGYNTTIADPGITLGRSLIYETGGFAVTPLTDGLRVGGAVEFAGLDAAPDYRRADAMLKKVKRILPGITSTAGEQWMGHRPALPDFVPVIGPSPHFRNVHYVFGHGHLGLTWGPTSGRMIAEMMARKPASIDPAPFRVDRF